jgi:hypothetical protein
VPSERGSWALEVAFSRDDVSWYDWLHAQSLLAGTIALDSVSGLEQRALEQALELTAERYRRLPSRASLPPVIGEETMTVESAIQAACSMLRHGGQATSMGAAALRCASLAGRDLTDVERLRMIRVIRSNIAEREVDRYLGGRREIPADFPYEPLEGLDQLEARTVGQLAEIQPDQVFRGMRVAFAGDLINALPHGQAVRFLLGRSPQVGRMALNRFAEQVSAQQNLVDLKATQQFDDLAGPPSLSFLDVLGTGFDDPRKMVFACAARELWERRGKPDGWSEILQRALATLD